MFSGKINKNILAENGEVNPNENKTPAKNTPK
jgi:hypothetical protein